MKTAFTTLISATLAAPAFAHNDAIAHVHTSQTTHVPLALLVGLVALGGFLAVRYLRAKP